MVFHEVISVQKKIEFPQKINFFQISIILFLVAFCFMKYESYQQEAAKTLAIISNPQVNDIYFLDFRLLSDKLRPKEKYRIAKVVDITGDVVTLLYGAFYFQHQNAAINSIRYGQLRYRDSFETKRYDIPLNEIKTMYNNQVIYLAKRPIRNKLYGNLVGPAQVKTASNHLIYGKKENIKGEAFLKEKLYETNLKSAFELFTKSSMLGYEKGQVNLAEMYINGYHVEKDLNKALYWLKEASLKSYKPAILKYGIICKQVSSCDIVDFYQELTNSGVNIKVRTLDVKLSK